MLDTSCRSESRQSDELNVAVTLPLRFSDLNFESIKITMTGVSGSGGLTQERLNSAGGSKLVISEVTFRDKAKKLAGHAVIGLSKNAGKEIALFACGQPPIAIRYDTNSDYTITRSGEPSLLIIKCTRKQK